MNINEILKIKIEKKSDARTIIRFFREYKNEENVIFDETMEEKERLAYRFLNTGCLTSPTLVSYQKEESTPPGSSGNCYRVTYKGEIIGYTAKIQDNWNFSERLETLHSSLIKGTMRKKVVDIFIQKYKSE